MKILYANGLFTNDSGCGIIANNTYEIFKQRGFDVEYFTTKEYCNNQNYKFYKYFPNTMSTLSKYLINIGVYYYNWKSQKGIERVLAEFSPDIFHVHSLRFASMSYSVLKPIIDRKIPIIMTLHDAYLVCPMMTLIDGNGKDCIKCKGWNKFHCFFNKCAPKGYEQSFRVALQSFVNYMTGYDKHIMKFISPSEALRNLILESNIGIKPDRIIIINNFLVKQELNTIPNYNNQGYFLYIGRLDKEKGVHYLLEAMKDLPKDIKLHIVGTGKEEQSLKEYAKEHNLDNVEFLGFKNREEIKKEYQNCISTILPCNWFEIFGMTNVESFINGKPVIASNIGGIPEIVEHNVSGLLFEPGNVEQLKECILKYRNNPQLVVEHGKNGYQKAVTQYTEDRYYKELMKVYEDVINGYQK